MQLRPVVLVSLCSDFFKAVIRWQSETLYFIHLKSFRYISSVCTNGG